MSRRNRLILAAVLLAILAIEVGMRVSTRPTGVVEVVNHGSGDVKDLRIRADGDETLVDRIEPGSSRSVRIGARSRCQIRLTFDQPGSALSLVQFDDFDPAALNAAGEKYVVELTDSGYRLVREDVGKAEDGLLSRVGRTLSNWWEGTPGG